MGMSIHLLVRSSSASEVTTIWRYTNVYISNNFDKTDRQYSLAPTDDLVRFWRSKVKVTAGV